jgi:hemerythrin-like domain-containing protein
VEGREDKAFEAIISNVQDVMSSVKRQEEAVEHIYHSHDHINKSDHKSYALINSELNRDANRMLSSEEKD